MKIQYITNDGKIFDNEIDCRLYESEKQVREFINKKELIFLSLSGQIIFGDIDSCAEKAAYIFINSKEALQALWGENECLREVRPSGEGYWYYDCECDVWKSMLSKFETLKNELSELNRIYNCFIHFIEEPQN